MNVTRYRREDKKRDDGNSEPEYLTYRQAAALLQLSERTLSTMKRNGEMPYIKLGKSVRFSRAALEQWLNDQSQGGAAGDSRRERDGKGRD